jgi:hypothetical protein
MDNKRYRRSTLVAAPYRFFAETQYALTATQRLYETEPRPVYACNISCPAYEPVVQVFGALEVSA